MSFAPTPRYDGKPFLRLLECYVLDAIGELKAEDRKTLLSLAPKLSQIYKHSGSWNQIIAASMDLPPDMPNLIREIWTQNQAKAKASGVLIDPQDFAEAFVDQNLV